MTFVEWLAELDAEAKRRGYGNYVPSEAGAEESWEEYYNDGFSPKDALDEDESCGW